MKYFVEYRKGKKQDIKTGITTNEYAGQISFIAVTQSQSKPFKTEKGADKWLVKMGYERVGISYETKLKIENRITELRRAI